MLNFKKLGVIMCEGQSDYQARLMKGITDCSVKLGYDVLVFTNFIKSSHLKGLEYGEKNIFNLINYELLDGVIVVGDTLKMDNLHEELLERLKNECTCPVVYVDYPVEEYDNVLVNDTSTFEKLIDHLIDAHDCKDILFYSGSYEVSTTQTRLTGYKNSLRKHNIPEKDELISFNGDFWYTGGTALAREIIEGKRAKPDAIAFSGDYMAIGAMKELQNNGWKIPEDIIIVGYDSVDESLRQTPPITSCEPPVYDAGWNAVVTIDCRIKGIEPCGMIDGMGKLEIGGSCGCNEDYTYTKRMLFDTSLEEYSTFLYCSVMEDLPEAEDFNDLLKKFQYYLFLVRDWNDYYLCLCNNLLETNVSSAEPWFYSDGYSKKMRLYIKSENKVNRSYNQSFDTKLMLPMIFEERERPKTFYFTPVHLNRKCFGYSVLSYGDKNMTFNRSFINYTKHIANALEFTRIQTEIAGIATHDMLTGVYTRLGIQKTITMLLDHKNDDDCKFFILVADVDGLKKINDTYGHQSGDIAITCVAKALSSVIRENEICARTGGDEFVVIGCGNYSDSYGIEFISRCLDAIKYINENSKLNFEISASFGSVVRKINVSRDLDNLYHEADNLMYEMKKANKRLRLD